MSIINIPNKWHDISILQLCQLADDNYINLDDFIQQLSILSGVDSDDECFYYLTDKDLSDFRDKLKFLSTPIPHHMSNYMTLNDIEYKLIDFNNMLVSEWITLEHYLGTNYKIHSAEIMATVWRRYIINEYGNEILEPFTYDFKERSEEMLSATLDYFPIYSLIEMRDKIFSNYKLNTDTPDDEDDDEDEDDYYFDEDDEDDKQLNYRDRAKQIEQKEKENNNSTYNWERILMSLSNDNANEAYKLLSVPILWIFSLISMKNTIK